MWYDALDGKKPKEMVTQSLFYRYTTPTYWRQPKVTEDHVVSTELTSAQLRERAAEYRRMAETAREASVVTSLLRLAERFDGVAGERDGGVV